MADYIPFGKHNGTPLKDVPLPYLRWFAKWYSTEADDPDEDVLASVREELKQRTGSGRKQTQDRQTQDKPTGTKRIPTGVRSDLAIQIVGEGRRALARKHHPDVPFGDLETMQQVNATADWLEANAREHLQIGGRK